MTRVLVKRFTGVSDFLLCRVSGHAGAPISIWAWHSPIEKSNRQAKIIERSSIHVPTGGGPPGLKLRRAGSPRSGRPVCSLYYADMGLIRFLLLKAS